MKRNFMAAAFIASLSLFASCGGKTDKKAESNADMKADTKTEVTLSTEMQDFMLNFNGRSASVRIALDDFGKPGLDRKDMDLYDLDKPVVLESNGNCHLMQFVSGMTKRKYNVCWEGGKISSIEDKGME